MLKVLCIPAISNQCVKGHIPAVRYVAPSHARPGLRGSCLKPPCPSGIHHNFPLTLHIMQHLLQTPDLLPLQSAHTLVKHCNDIHWTPGGNSIEKDYSQHSFQMRHMLCKGFLLLQYCSYLPI